MEGDRVKRGETAGKFTLSNGSEAPLTLMRSGSQSCDPHRAYILLELGSFEDTVGRVNHDDFEIPKGSRSSSFFFKAAAKIPVDTVGVHRYPLDRNVEKRPELQGRSTDSRALGWIIVRVALKEGIKLVSVESPFVVKSNADADILCEIRDHNGLSLLWRCLVPKMNGHRTSASDSAIVSVPADIVPFIHDGSYIFSVAALSRDSSFVHEADLQAVHPYGAVQVPAPPPYSPFSFSKGLIDETEITLVPFSPASGQNAESLSDRSENINLDVCSIRIGSLSGMKPTIDIPEQRMLFFRSPVVIINYLAFPIVIQVRLKSSLRAERKANSSTSTKRVDTLKRHATSLMGDWEDLGILDCGQGVNWTGALSTDKVELRIRFSDADAEGSRRFPTWSTSVIIPAKEKGSRLNGRTIHGTGRAAAQMKVCDPFNVPLQLSVSIGESADVGDNDPAVHDNIRRFSRSFAPAARVISIYVPYWIVDGTGEDLEFFSGAPVAGQLNHRVPGEGKNLTLERSSATMGLAELFDDEKLLHLPSRSPFEVSMIGDEKSTRLTVRRSLYRKRGTQVQNANMWPWSDPIPLQSDQSAQHDIHVLTSNKDLLNTQESANRNDGFETDRFSLRASIVDAPARFGGNLGTKLIHIHNRFAILNEMGRDIEIASDSGSGVPVLVRAGSRPRPFHFDDSKPMRFRFKEFGWRWSGQFSIRENRREVTLRIRHRMKDYTVIATVECHAGRKSATSLIVFRQASHPPFRLENHSMYPLHFGQLRTLMSAEESVLDSMLLPYQSADFAWDEPEIRRRAMMVKAAGSAEIPKSIDAMLGRFFLDRLAPGTELHLESSTFHGDVVADGPTRVLRISDASMPRLPSFRPDESSDFSHKFDMARAWSLSLALKFSQGIGVSIVDWAPQELVYVRLDDIQLERKIDFSKDAVSITVGNIKVNNQLWVTPYPVFLKMGKRADSSSNRRRNRRQNAVSLSWCRSLNTHGGYGDLTLVERVELSTEPVFINADGNLANLLVRMAKQISGRGNSDLLTLYALSRDDELIRALDLSHDKAAGTRPFECLPSSDKSLATFEWSTNSDFMVTSAIAAKLKSRSRHKSSNRLIRMESGPQAEVVEKKSSSLSKPLHKFYIERLRISAVKSELSWSGPLPGAFSSLLLRALTFEGLPLRLRPYSSSHAYGTLEDHLQSLKSHYLSFWRIFDLLMGLSYNPTFIIRAVIYTCRESFASMFDASSEILKSKAEGIIKQLPKDDELHPIYDDGLPIYPTISRSLALRRALFGPFLNATSIFLRNSASFNAWGASLLRYGPQHAGARRSTRGLVRSRNPRLFANVDGKDLLVEYVEGENAGKALLSRVRMGMHLGEGYIFHTEGARQKRSKSRSSTDLDATPLIVMMTSERIMLLNGKLDISFCSVIWESMFEDVVYIEVNTLENSMGTYDAINIWYLCNPGHAAGNIDDRKSRYAKAVVGDCGGVDVLLRKQVFIPLETGKQLLRKVEGIDSSLVESDESDQLVSNT